MSDEPSRRELSYLLLRKIHRLLGILVFPLVLLMAGTGLYLNHPKFFSRLLVPPPVAVSTRPNPWTFEAARELAQDILGGPVSKINKKRQKGRYYFRPNPKSRGRIFVIMEPSSRTYWLVGRYKKKRFSEKGEFIERQMLWRRIAKDIHVGRFWDWGGRLLVDILSLCLVFFATTGGLMWFLRRFRGKKRPRIPS